jgi:hypothetical protein
MPARQRRARKRFNQNFKMAIKKEKNYLIAALVASLREIN